MRFFFVSIGLIGALLFGSALVISYLQPIWVEQAAREIIRNEVQKRTAEKIEALSNTKIVSMAEKLAQIAQVDTDDAKRKLKEDLPLKVAEKVAQMGNPDCECRKDIKAVVGSFLESRVAIGVPLQTRVMQLIHSKYIETAQALLREFRIFTATNAFVFGFLAFIAWRHKTAGKYLILPSFVLCAASGMVGYLYLTQQNWLYTVVFSNYVGLTYLIYLSAALALLSDVAFNKARLTAATLNGVSQLLSLPAKCLPL